MSDFPTDLQLRHIREWCAERRGSNARIAKLVRQHNGTVGVNHSAVSRTLAGRERNTLVIAAYRKLRAATEAREAREAKAARAAK